MVKLVASVLLIASVAAAQDAVTILAKARAAFIENRERERFWTWNTISTRSVTGKNGEVLQSLPSLTTESPIRSDGKRCTAVLAWGDGVEPYLSNASADERCAVEKEVRQTFRMEAFLESKRVRIQSRTGSLITLAIREDKTATEAEDIVRRCVASARGTVQVDRVTFFPVMIEVNIPGEDCAVKHDSAVNHYDDTQIRNVTSGFTKGTILQFEYALQLDKSGSSDKDFWICERNHSVRPFVKGSSAVLVSGRRFQLTSTASQRNMLLDAKTVATELAAESLIKFETEKEK